MTVLIGYQGIGKSSIASKYSDFVDFESGNFWVDGRRADDWYKPYAQCVLDLSSQGLNVFTASHKPYREYIYEINSKREKPEPIYIIHPSIELKDFWIGKLQDRYNRSGLDKDYRALMNAKDRYVDNIRELLDDPIPSVVIKDRNYDLVTFLLENIPNMSFFQRRKNNE